MTQEIKIGVNADTGAAVNRVRDLGQATDKLADALTRVGQAGAGAARGVNDLAGKVKAAQTVLSKELGAPVSETDTKRVLENFERIRTGNGIGARRTRLFDDFTSWYKGHGRTFKRASDADQHRRLVMGAALQGTSFADAGGPGGGGPPGGGWRGGGPGGSSFSRGVARAQSSAMSFVKGGLALAGIGSVMGMLGSAVDSASEESTGIDTLKRRIGDLGFDFDELRKSVRQAADGFGVTYVESARLAQQFSRVSGSSGGRIGGDLNTSIGFSRAFGLDPAEGVQLFASMRRLGVTGQDDQSSRRLAMMIADSIAKGGFTAKADEVLRAVADFAQQAARASFSAPNVGAYAANFAGLTGLGLPGLDPGAAQGILARANSAMMRGGAMGEASMNLIYAALGRGHDPVWAQSLMAGGLFGTEAGVFGKGTAAGRFFYGEKGIQGGSNITNWQRVRDLLVERYGSKNPLLIDAIRNVFGLSSPQEAMVFRDMSPQDITASRRLIERAGVDPDQMNTSASLALARIAGNGPDAGRAILAAAKSFQNRSDLTAEEKKALAEAMDKGIATRDLDPVREQLARLYAAHGQEANQGSAGRASLVDVKNALTAVGDKLFDPLNEIRSKVVAMAGLLGIGAAAPEPGKLTNGETMTPAQQAITNVLGKPVDPNVPRGVRNHNPGNLKGWGSEHDSAGYDRFGTDQEGLSAMAGNLLAYAKKHGINTIGGIIDRWEGNPFARVSYKEDVSKRSGFGIRQKLDMNDPRTVAALENAMIWHENGQNPYKRDQVEAAVASRMGLPLPANDPNGAAERARTEHQLTIGLNGVVEMPVAQGGQPLPGARLKAMPTITAPPGTAAAGLSIGGGWN